MSFINQYPHNLLGSMPEIFMMIAYYCGTLMIPALRCVSRAQMQLLTDEWVNANIVPLTLIPSQIQALQTSASLDEALAILSTHTYYNANDGMQAILDALSDEAVAATNQLHLPDVLQRFPRHGGNLRCEETLRKVFQLKPILVLSEIQLKTLETATPDHARGILDAFLFRNANEAFKRLLDMLVGSIRAPPSNEQRRIICILEMMLKHGAKLTELPPLNYLHEGHLATALDDWHSDNGLGYEVFRLMIAGLPAKDTNGVVRGSIMRSMSLEKFEELLGRDKFFRDYIFEGPFVDPFSCKIGALLNTFRSSAQDSAGRNLAMKILHCALGPHFNYYLDLILSHSSFEPCSLHQVDSKGQTILKETIGHVCVEWKAFRRLVQASAHPFHRDPLEENQSYAMQVAQKLKEPRKLVRLLLDWGKGNELVAGLNQQDDKGLTLLHHLIKNKRCTTRCVEELLAAGANPDLDSPKSISVRQGLLNQSLRISEDLHIERIQV